MDFINALDGILWGPFVLIPLLLLTGLYLTVILRVIQFRKLFQAFYLAFVVRKEDGAERFGDVSHFQALTTGLAATVGTANIIGVGTAIAVGGPGALFWMWMTAIVGTATKYSEAVLGLLFRRRDAAGEMVGGPMFYLSEGVGSWYGRGLAFIFAGAGILAPFGIGNMVQSNAVSSALDTAFGIPVLITAGVMTLGAAVIILGGIKTIGSFTSVFVPFMGLLYIAGSTVVILANFDQIPAAFATIVSTAFTGTAATGGFAGAGIIVAIQLGVARGLFSNEAGLGTGGIAASAAQTQHAPRQGIISMTQTFVDTIIVCSFTGLAIVTTGVWKTEGLASDELTQMAFKEIWGSFGPALVAVALACLAFSTVIGWGYYGERNTVYIFGRKGVLPYRLIYVAAVFVGALFPLELIWIVSDIMNGFMVIPNLIGILLLSPLVVRETKAYFGRGGTEEKESEPSVQ